MDNINSRQLKFDWDLPEEENSALSAEEVQLRKDLAEAFLRNPEHWEKDEAGKPIKPFWLDHAITLHEGRMRFPFRVAVLTAWLCTPKQYRYPKTQDQLANLLGLSSDRQFTVWMARNPQIRRVVHNTWKENALDRIHDSLEAMYEVASIADYKGKGDRELHFKLAGILSDKLILDKSEVADLSKLSFEEKLKLAGLDGPDALLKWREELKGHDLDADDDEEEQDASIGGT